MKLTDRLGVDMPDAHRIAVSTQAASGTGVDSSSVIDSAAVLSALVAEVETVVLGKHRQVRLALACLLAKGHLLIEDLPGMGKTTLAQTLAAVLGFGFNRIQFTSDLLPVDVLGASIYNSRDQQFEFQPGPVFSQLVLADEINRATPKAQSALLEAMEERQVSVEGVTYPLPEPFFVIATQNPINQTGTYSLPESQLDRFLMRIELGYPDPHAERLIMQGVNPREKIAQINGQLSLEIFQQLQALAQKIHLSDPLLDYIQRLVLYSRQSNDFDYGLSPRGALALIAATRAWALLEGRDYVIPEDVQQVLPSVAEHRFRANHSYGSQKAVSLSQKMLDEVEVLG